MNNESGRPNILATTVSLETKYACKLSENEDYVSRLHEFVHNKTVNL